MSLQTSDLLYVVLDDGSYKSVTWTQIQNREVPETAKLLIERQVGADNTWTQFSVPITSLYANEILDTDLFMVERGLELYGSPLRVSPGLRVGFVSTGDGVQGNIYFTSVSGTPVTHIKPDGTAKDYATSGQSNVEVREEGVHMLIGQFKTFKITCNKGFVDGTASTAGEWDFAMQDNDTWGDQAFADCRQGIRLPGLTFKTGLKTFYKTTFTEEDAIADIVWDPTLKKLDSTFLDSKGDVTLNINEWNVENIEELKNTFKQTRLKGLFFTKWKTKKLKKMIGTFSDVDALEAYPDQWDTSKVTNMFAAFEHNSGSFNIPLVRLDTSSVKNFASCFIASTKFNQDIDTWDTSSATNMSYMFSRSKFNHSLNSWKVSNVSNMDYMFSDNGNMVGDCSEWCVPLITSEPPRFAESQFPMNKRPKWGTCPLSQVKRPVISGVEGDESVVGLRDTLYLKVNGETDPPANSNSYEYRRNPSTSASTNFESWPVVATTEQHTVSELDANHQFVLKQTAINGSKSRVMWSNVVIPFIGPLADEAIYFTFEGSALRIAAQRSSGTPYNPDIYRFTGGSWVQVGLLPPWSSGSLYYSTNQDGLYGIKSADVQSIHFGSGGTSFIENGPLTSWNCSADAEIRFAEKSCMAGLTSAAWMFAGLMRFNQDMTWWARSWNVTNMAKMFRGCSAFNQPVNDWKIDNVVNLGDCFSHCFEFNQPVNKWNTNNVNNVSGLFIRCKKFNQHLDSWNLNNITKSCTYFLAGCEKFNGRLGTQTFQSISLMGFLDDCTVFNQSVSGLDVSACTDVQAFFVGCENFNQSLSNFNAPKTESLRYMFANCFKFNQNISHWDTSNVRNMQYFASSASVFNQPIGGWNISGITNVEVMFRSTNQFYQDLSGWDCTGASGSWKVFEDSKMRGKKSFYPQGVTG